MNLKELLKKLLLIAILPAIILLVGCDNSKEYTEEFSIIKSNIVQSVSGSRSDIILTHKEKSYVVTDPNLYKYCNDRIGNKIRIHYIINSSNEIEIITFGE